MSNRRAYPIDPTNTLSFNNTQPNQGQAQYDQFQQTQNQNQQQQQQPNQYQPQQQQQQQQQQQYQPHQQQGNGGYQLSPEQQQQNMMTGNGGVGATTTTPTPATGTPGESHKRVYPVDPINEGMLQSNFSAMSLATPPVPNTAQIPHPVFTPPVYQNTNQLSPQQQQQPYNISPQQQQQQQQHTGYQQFIPNTPVSPVQQQPVQVQQQQQPQQFQSFVPQYNNQQPGQQQQYYQQPTGQQQYPMQQPGQQQYSMQQPNQTTFSQEPAIPTNENQCPKQYMRLSMDVIPNTPAMLSKSHIPLGVVIHPLANAPNDPIPVINSTIVRCRSCRAYINPFVLFTDGGGRWRCNICQFLNDTPADYISPINLTTGKRFDIDKRPELIRGCVEFVATSEYAVRAPQPPSYFFVIDVCYESIVSGMLTSAVNAIRSSLSDLPGDSRTRFGIMTFDDQIHLFNLKSNASHCPQMLVVTEMDNVFVPPYDEFMVNLKDNRELIENTLNIIANMGKTMKTQKVESCLGSALKAAYSITHNVGGKLVVFQSYIPRGPLGKLPIRDFASLLGTKKEVSLLQPSNEGEFYKEFALNCSQMHISIDIFLFSGDYTDVASLGTMCQITGGELHYYPGFTTSRDGPTFEANLYRALTRQTAWEAVMRVRNSRGLNTTAYHGNYFLKSSDLLALPAVDADKAFALQLSVTENINAKYAALQSALLYTHSCGERRVRVFTVSIPVVNNYHDLFKNADISVVVNLISKMAIDKALSSTISDAREAIANKCAEILIAYKSVLAANPASNSVTLSSQAPKLLLPESLKHLPLYVVAMVKNIIFSSKHTHPDQRSFFMQRMKILDANLALNFFYPYFYSLLEHINPIYNNISSNNNNGQQSISYLLENFHLPSAHKLSADELSRTGAYIIVNGYTIYLFVGENIHPQIHMDIFGCDFPQLDQNQFTELPVLENDTSKYIRKVVETIRSNFVRAMKIYLIKGNTNRRSEIQSLLVEDRTPEGSSYYEFILQLQNRVLQ